MKIYLPSWNGDMRLEAKDDHEALLTLTAPTPQERMIAGDFLRHAAKEKWWDGTPPKKGEPYTGDKLEIPIQASLAKASKALITFGRPKDRTLTAVKFGSGKIEIVEGATATALAAIEKSVGKAKAEETKEKEAKAASVKRPTPSCPQCEPGAIGPASEVLLSFLSPRQHEEWARERAILVEGHLSGHRYVIAHRNSRIAAQVGRICYDADDQGVMHFHDWSVPPEEEVLSAKLILEHAEPWLRNEATCLGGRHTDVYKNPFGDGLDGVESSTFATNIGYSLQGFLESFG
jgi:hypothetical protein